VTSTAVLPDPVLPDQEPLRRKDRVVAAVDLPGIPAGTEGRVIMVSGFSWIRYWIRFDNGVERGSISRSALVRPGEPWGEALAELRANAAAPVAAADGPAAVAGADAGGVEVAGVMIPAHLLERTKTRREVLGV
jgi:hypothetical protein